MADKEKGPGSENVLFERRRFIRVDATFVVSYKDAREAAPKTDVTQTRNISVGGILFITDRSFPEGTILDLKIRLPETADYIDVKVHVVHCKERAKNLIYETSAKFVEIKDKHKDSIDKLIAYYVERDSRNKKERGQP